MSGDEKMIDLARNFLMAMGDKKFEEGLGYLADDCVYENMPMGMDAVTGPAAVRAVLEPFFGPTLANEFVFHREVASGSTVFIERTDRHKLAEDRWVELPVTGVFEIEDGKIKLWRDYFDLPTILTAWPELAG